MAIASRKRHCCASTPQAAARAALSLAGRELRKRPVRLTRVSVQQQQRIKQQRAALAVQKGKKPSGPQGSARPSPGGGGKGGAKGSVGGDSEAWQGTRTKGKGKEVRGSKPQSLGVVAQPMKRLGSKKGESRARGGSLRGDAHRERASEATAAHLSLWLRAGGLRREGGKRPAVAARKAAQKQAKSPKASGPASKKPFKPSGNKKPFKGGKK